MLNQRVFDSVHVEVKKVTILNGLLWWYSKMSSLNLKHGD